MFRFFSFNFLALQIVFCNNIFILTFSAHSMPVVRNQTFVHIMDWLKLASSEKRVSSNVFPLVKDVVMAGITDIWSAIRNTCVAKLSKFLDIFTLPQVEEFYTSLVKVMLSSVTNRVNFCCIRCLDT